MQIDEYLMVRKKDEKGLSDCQSALWKKSSQKAFSPCQFQHGCTRVTGMNGSIPKATPS